MINFLKNGYIFSRFIFFAKGSINNIFNGIVEIVFYICKILIDRYVYDLATITFELNLGLGQILSWTLYPGDINMNPTLFFQRKIPALL
jgi:hypothetical protein